MPLKWLGKPGLRPINKESTDRQPVQSTKHSCKALTATRMLSYLLAIVFKLSHNHLHSIFLNEDYLISKLYA